MNTPAAHFAINQWNGESENELESILLLTLCVKRRRLRKENYMYLGATYIHLTLAIGRLLQPSSRAAAIKPRISFQILQDVQGGI